MFALRVQDTDLYGKTMRLDRKLVKGVSLYPFFRETGEVVYLMLVLPGESRVFMAPYKKWQVAVYFWGGVRLDITPERLETAANFRAKDIRGLYHYDAKWVLSEARFSNYRAKDLIKQTNCAEAVQEQAGDQIRHLRFTRDLSTLVSFAVRSRGIMGAHTLRAENILTALPGASIKKVGPEKETWVLDPVWHGRNPAGPWAKPFEWR